MFEALPSGMLHLLCDDGRPLLPLCDVVADLPAPRALRRSLRLLWRSLRGPDPCGDLWPCGKPAPLLGTGCGLFPPRHPLSHQPTDWRWGSTTADVNRWDRQMRNIPEWGFPTFTCGLGPPQSRFLANTVHTSQVRVTEQVIRRALGGLNRGGCCYETMMLTATSPCQPSRRFDHSSEHPSFSSCRLVGGCHRELHGHLLPQRGGHAGERAHSGRHCGDTSLQTRPVRQGSQAPAPPPIPSKPADSSVDGGGQLGSQPFSHPSITSHPDCFFSVSTGNIWSSSKRTDFSELLTKRGRPISAPADFCSSMLTLQPCRQSSRL